MKFIILIKLGANKFCDEAPIKHKVPMVMNLPCSFDNNEKGFFVVPEKPKMHIIKRVCIKLRMCT